MFLPFTLQILQFALIFKITMWSSEHTFNMLYTGAVSVADFSYAK